MLSVDLLSILWKVPLCWNCIAENSVLSRVPLCFNCYAECTFWLSIAMLNVLSTVPLCCYCHTEYLMNNAIMLSVVKLIAECRNFLFLC
jgi:hypothetical protein